MVGNYHVSILLVLTFFEKFGGYQALSSARPHDPHDSGPFQRLPGRPILWLSLPSAL